MMFRRIPILLSTFLVATEAINKDFLNEEIHNKIMEEMQLEEEQARGLIGIEADGSLGSKCGWLDPCNPGFDCFHNRCIPNRDCMKERLAEFDASFDSDDYKRKMFKTTGVTEEDIVLAYKESDGDELVFANSRPLQSLVEFMQANSEPFDPVTEIVNSCAGVVSGRRLHVDEDKLKAAETSSHGDAETASYGEGKTRNLQSTPTVSLAPSTSFAPSMVPSMAPSVARNNTVFLGLHLEGGLVFELALTVAWREGDTTSGRQQYARGCFGAVFGGGVEFSFYVAQTFDGVDDGWGCGSVLFSVDAGFGLNLGMGLGICFAQSSSVYLEFTIGGGIGAGMGFSSCFVAQRDANPTTRHLASAPAVAPLP